MTEREIYCSPRFVDFSYEPGTSVLGGMWLNKKVFDLCVQGSFLRGLGGIRQNI
ncbi:hypothetical protein IQ244_28015 [Nostoc sp. LEGE 06077]|nr:hypothetical protein [Nostoc sp. LEGE 06077]